MKPRPQLQQTARLEEGSFAFKRDFKDSAGVSQKKGSGVSLTSKISRDQLREFPMASNQSICH